MNIPLQAVAEGRAEMAFWPVAASLFVYSTTSSALDILAVIIFTIAASQTYILLRNISKIVDSQKGKQKTRERVGRDGVSDKMSVFKSSMDEFWSLFPENKAVSCIVLLSLLVESLGGVLFWFRLFEVTPVFANPPFGVMVVLLLPLVYFATVSARILWQI